MPLPEDFLTLYCDPGEDFGWAVGQGLDLLAAGTHKMWTFADLIWEKLQEPYKGNDANPLQSNTHLREDADEMAMNALAIKRVVCEDFRIYPWKVNDLKFDQVRTARVIGAIQMMCRIHDIPLHLQGANIKKAAQAAGAEELYYRPLRENRHQNDAIQHFVWYTNVELLGINFPIPDSNPEDYE